MRVVGGNTSLPAVLFRDQCVSPHDQLGSQAPIPSTVGTHRHTNPCTAYTLIPSLQAPQPCPPRMQVGPGCWRRAQHRVNYLLLQQCWSTAGFLPPAALDLTPPSQACPSSSSPAHWCSWLYFSARDQLFPCQTFMFLFNSLSASQISTDRLLQCLPWKKMRCHKLFLIQVNKISSLFNAVLFDVGG